MSKVAALTHVDKDQTFDSVVDIIHAANFGPNELQVHFYGGSAAPGGNMKEESTNTTKQLLNALIRYNSGEGQGKLTICAFDVLTQPHNRNLTFDVRDGHKYCEFWSMPPGYLGFPLDSKFRYWPSGRYFADMDGSKLAQTELDFLNTSVDDEIAQNDLTEFANMLGLQVEVPMVPKNDMVKAYLKKIRCQWNGTPSGSDEFKSEVNQLVCSLVVDKAIPERGIEGIDMKTKEGKDALHKMINYLYNKDQPMAFEQGLKRWCAWDTHPHNGMTPAPDDSATMKDLAAISVVAKVAEVFVMPNLTISMRYDQFKAAVDLWAKDNALPFENLI